MPVPTLEALDSPTELPEPVIAALIAVAAITAMQSLGSELNTTFNTVQSKMAEGNAAA